MRCRQFFRLFCPFLQNSETKKADPNRFSSRLNVETLAKKQEVIQALLNTFGCEFKLLDPDTLIFIGKEIEVLSYLNMPPAYYFGPYSVEYAYNPLYDLLNVNLGHFIKWIESHRVQNNEKSTPLIDCNNLIKIADHFESLSKTLASTENLNGNYAIERFKQQKILKDRIKMIINNFIASTNGVKEEKSASAPSSERKDSAPSAPVLELKKAM